jgi:hypothetical protein
MQVGENIAIPSNDYDWSILDYVGYQMCTCAWGMFDRWMKRLIQNKRHCHFWLLPYDRLQQGNRSYILGNDKPIAYVFSHLVLAFKFTMSPTNHTTWNRC